MHNGMRKVKAENEKLSIRVLRGLTNLISYIISSPFNLAKMLYIYKVNITLVINTIYYIYVHIYLSRSRARLQDFSF
jgi:hypothetical protein